MRLNLTMNLDNSAFADNAGGEAARILQACARRFDDGLLYVGVVDTLMDANGNTVGEVTVSRSDGTPADELEHEYAVRSPRLDPAQRRILADAVAVLRETAR